MSDLGYFFVYVRAVHINITVPSLVSHGRVNMSHFFHFNCNIHMWPSGAAVDVAHATTEVSIRRYRGKWFVGAWSWKLSPNIVFVGHQGKLGNAGVALPM